MVSVHPVARPLWPPHEVPQNEDDGDLTLEEFEKLFPTQRHAKRKRGEPAKLIEYLWWSSKKKMKKAGVLYASVHEDRIEMPLRYPIAWATLRHLQCRELTQLLVSHLVPKVDAKMVNEAIMCELEAVVDWVLEHARQCSGSWPLGSAGLWAVVMFQQHYSFYKRRKWEADSAKEAKELGIAQLWSFLVKKVADAPAESCSQKLHAIEPFEACSENQRVGEIQALHAMLKESRIPLDHPDVTYLRSDHKDEPWIFDGILKMEEPFFVETVDFAFGSKRVSSSAFTATAGEEEGETLPV